MVLWFTFYFSSPLGHDNFPVDQDGLAKTFEPPSTHWFVQCFEQIQGSQWNVGPGFAETSEPTNSEVLEFGGVCFGDDRDVFVFLFVAHCFKNLMVFKTGAPRGGWPGAIRGGRRLVTGALLDLEAARGELRAGDLIGLVSKVFWRDYISF